MKLIASFLKTFCWVSDTLIRKKKTGKNWKTEEKHRYVIFLLNGEAFVKTRPRVLLASTSPRHRLVLASSSSRHRLVLASSSSRHRLVLASSSSRHRLVLASSSYRPRLVLASSSPHPRLAIVSSSPRPCLFLLSSSCIAIAGIFNFSLNEKLRSIVTPLWLRYVNQSQVLSRSIC